MEPWAAPLSPSALDNSVACRPSRWPSSDVSAWTIRVVGAEILMSASSVPGRVSYAVAGAGLVPRRQGQQRAHATSALDPDVELRVAAARGFGDRREPSQRLAEAVKLVAAARDRGAAPDLQYALIEVAAVAMDWAATSRLAAVSRPPQGTR